MAINKRQDAIEVDINKVVELADSGMHHKDIAARYGVCRATVSQWLKECGYLDGNTKSKEPWTKAEDSILCKYWQMPHINLTELVMLTNGVHRRTKTRKAVLQRAEELGLPKRFETADLPGPHPNAEPVRVVTINGKFQVHENFVSVARVPGYEMNRQTGGNNAAVQGRHHHR